jgi:hypothetical protein
VFRYISNPAGFSKTVALTGSLRLFNQGNDVEQRDTNILAKGEGADDDSLNRNFFSSSDNTLDFWITRIVVEVTTKDVSRSASIITIMLPPHPQERIVLTMLTTASNISQAVGIAQEREVTWVIRFMMHDRLPWSPHTLLGIAIKVAAALSSQEIVEHR